MEDFWFRPSGGADGQAAPDTHPARAALDVLRQISPSAPVSPGDGYPSPEMILAAYDRAGPSALPPQTTAPPLPKAPQQAWRNNNPLNLRGGGWDGDLGKTEGGFSFFKTPQDGLRAAAAQLHKDGKKLKTIEGIVRKLSPPSENKTEQMIKDIAGMAGLDPKAPLDFDDPAVLEKILRAYTRREDAESSGRFDTEAFATAVKKALEGIPGSAPAAYGRAGNFASSRAPALTPAPASAPVVSADPPSDQEEDRAAVPGS